MSQLGQALKVARQRMASGLTGRDLKESLQDVFSQLNSVESIRLANRIAKEEYFLGQAAHDPNLYANCNMARKAKQISANKNLMVLTYKTPVCASCTYNRQGNCGLMGGKLIAGPDDTPEIAVQRTGDILSSEGHLSSISAGRLASRTDVSPTVRLQTMHKKRLGGFSKNEPNVSAQIQARRIASILEPGDGETTRGKNLDAPSSRKAANTEKYQLESPDITSDRTASQRVSFYESIMKSPDLNVISKPEPGISRSRKAEVDPYGSTMSLPRESKRENKDIEEDNALQAQTALQNLTLRSSRLLAKGQMTSTLATKIIDRIQVMEDFGARHSSRSEAVKRQLSALSGGLEY
jgi:hypothetical protein